MEEKDGTRKEIEIAIYKEESRCSEKSRRRVGGESEESRRIVG